MYDHEQLFCSSSGYNEDNGNNLGIGTPPVFCKRKESTSLGVISEV